jgi:hypothetical protein
MDESNVPQWFTNIVAWFCSIGICVMILEFVILLGIRIFEAL